MAREVGLVEARMVSVQGDLIAELRREVRAGEAKIAELERQVRELKGVVAGLRRIRVSDQCRAKYALSVRA